MYLVNETFLTNIENSIKNYSKRPSDIKLKSRCVIFTILNFFCRQLFPNKEKPWKRGYIKFSELKILWRFLKGLLSTSQKSGIICSSESPLKVEKSAFYFSLKAFSFSRYFTFCPDILGYIRKREYKSLKCLARNMHNFIFLENSLGLVLHDIFCIIFQENISHVIFY